MLIAVKSMYGEALQQISIPPAVELSNPTYTLAVDGWVGFVCVVPVHEIGPLVILLVVNVVLFNVRDGDALLLTYILKSPLDVVYKILPL